MYKIVSLFFGTTLILLNSAQSIAADTAKVEPSASDDKRQLVSMPEQAQQFLRTDMLDHMSALNEIIGYLAENKLDDLAKVAESRMGRSSMGKHRGTGMGPGRFMPDAMRQIGWGMHDAATELSEKATKGDVKGVYTALQKVTGSCVACHYSYRIK